MKEGITRKQSSVIQGAAILLMFWHHFFSDLELYGGRLLFWNREAVWRGAWFGKICVGLFAFVSGYGMFYVMGRSGENRFFPRLLQDYKIVLHRLFSLYRKYWLVFFLLPGIELIAGVREFEAGEFFGNLFAFSSTYQSTWWYMGQYVKMFLLLPLLELFFLALPNREERKKRIVFYGALLAAGVLLTAAGLILYRPLWDFLLQMAKNLRISFFLPFCVGFLTARFRIYQWLAEKQEKTGRAWTTATAALALVLTVAVRVKLSDYAAYAEVDFLLVPVFVYGFLTLSALAPPLEKALAWFGRHSVYMWLLHGWIYSHMWVWLTEYVHSALLFYVILLGLSAAAAYLQLLVCRLCSEAVIKNKNFSH